MSDQTLNGHLCRLVGELVRQGISLQQASREFERQYLLAALREHEGSLSRSASSLGVHRNTLRNKMAALRHRAPGLRSRSRRPRRARRRALNPPPRLDLLRLASAVRRHWNCLGRSAEIPVFAATVLGRAMPI